MTQEVTFLRNYLAVEAVRYAPTHTISFDTQGQPAGTVIAPLLLLPFLENAFKYGLQPALSPGYLHVLLVLFEQELVLGAQQHPARWDSADAGRRTWSGYSYQTPGLTLSPASHPRNQ